MIQLFNEYLIDFLINISFDYFILIKKTLKYYYLLIQNK